MQVRWTTAAASLADGFSTQLLNVSAQPKEEERFLSAQADAFAGANASACSVRNDGVERGSERGERAGQGPSLHVADQRTRKPKPRRFQDIRLCCDIEGSLDW